MTGPCDHLVTEPALLIKANGGRVVVNRCRSCGSNRGVVRAATDADSGLPLHNDKLGTRPPCERCGAAGTERHHFYPVELDGYEEADRWPTAWLCPKCHRRWHAAIRRLAGGR